MRSFLRSLFPLALALAFAGCSTKKDANERRLVLFFTTDEHSQLFASAPELDDFLMAPGATGTGTLKGGVARRMTILQRERAAATARGAATLTFSSGDFSQGSLASAAWLATSPELAMMSRMGYDAVALGNHEFDLGPEALAQAISSAGAELPPLVLSNLYTPGALAPIYGTSKPIAPYRIVNAANGLRIGVVASMGVGAGTVAGAAPPGSFWDPTKTSTTAQFGSVLAQVQAQVDAVRREGVDAVVLLAHGGIAAAQPAQGEDELMALQLNGVDVVLSGHSHLFTPQPRIVYGMGKAVPVVQPMPYGRNVGKVELVFREDDSAPRPFLDPNGTKFYDVDDRTLPTADAAFASDLQTRTIGFLEFGLDGPTSTALPSFLESTLSRVTGTTVTADPLHPGSLWNKPLGQLDVRVEGLAPGETNAMDLDTDAILAAVNEVQATEIAAQASGPVRGNLEPGTTGAIGFADVYHLAPLGGDPGVAAPANMADPVQLQTYLNAVPGYPLVRVNVPTAALRLVFEATLQYSFQNGDFFVAPAGMVVHYDLSRPPVDLAAAQANPLLPGWVTYMALENGTVLYDVHDPGLPAPYQDFHVPPTALRSIATTYYVAGFASAFGVTLYDDTGHPYGKAVDDCTPNPPGVCGAGPLTNAIVVRSGSHIKDYEALARFIAGACAANTANPGFLPAAYGATMPVTGRRMLNCTGACPAI